MIWSYVFGRCKNALWFSFTMKGMRCTYLRDARPSVPRVVATALHSPARASSRRFSGSKYSGLLEKLAAAECSMPWSTGRIERYPLPPSRPWLNTVPRLRSTLGLRSLLVNTRIEVVGTRQGEALRGERLRRVGEEGVRVIPEECADVGGLAHGSSAYRRVIEPPLPLVGGCGSPPGCCRWRFRPFRLSPFCHDSRFVPSMPPVCADRVRGRAWGQVFPRSSSCVPIGWSRVERSGDV